jgi:hypothetical protein
MHEKWGLVSSYAEFRQGDKTKMSAVDAILACSLLRDCEAARVPEELMRLRQGLPASALIAASESDS